MRLVTGLIALAALAACNGDPEGPMPGQVGGVCARNADCDTGLCLEIGRCTASCNEAMPCPDSWTCDSLPGAGLVCQCTPSGEEELCDGVDNDCDGRVDNGAMCAPGLVCEGGECTCPADERCDGECVDRMTSPLHCGACGNACPAGQACEAGACVIRCTDPQIRCGDSCADTTSDRLHCGGCNNDCGMGATCRDSACECGMGTDLCGTTCVNLQTDSANCGSCGRACGASEQCVASSCECQSGTIRCGSACVDTQTSDAHCGTCGNACPGGQSCVMGACRMGCGAGQTLCGASCVNTMTDRSNCGTCGNVCPSGQTCSAGACRMDCGAMTLCGASCVDTTSDNRNCGTCGNTCGATETCTMGACRSAAVPVGAPCSTSADCVPAMMGECLPAPDWPGGYCSLGCAGRACPTGSTCVDIAGVLACLDDCAVPADCRTGYMCTAVGGGAMVCF